MVTDALLWLIVAAGIGLIAAGCRLTRRPHRPVANEFPARYHRAA